jgi:hypothetical protein
MSNLPEAAPENGESTHDQYAEAASVGSGESSSSQHSSFRAPFDFTLKLDLGGSRGTLSSVPKFEPRPAPRLAPTIAPLVAPEPLFVDPSEFRLEQLLTPDFLAQAQVRLLPEVAVVEKVSVVEEVAAVEEVAVLAPSEVALPMLPKPAVSKQAEAPAPDARAHAAAPNRLMVQRPADVNVTTKKPKSRKKGKLLMALFVVITLLAVGGGILLKQRQDAARIKQWPVAIKPIAALVEATFGLPFDRSVLLVELPQAEYEAKLGIYEFARVSTDTNGQLSGLRAVGLIASAPSAAQVGEYVGLTQTAFYDPATTTVYAVTNSSGPLHDGSVLAALSVALLDQATGWGAAVDTLSPAQQLGYLSLIEGAGSYAIANKSENDAAFAAEYATQRAAQVTTRDALPQHLSPWLVGVFDMQAANSWGVATRILAGDFVAGLNVPSSDAAVLDSARGLETPAGAATTDASSLGMYFWYGLLYPAVGNEFAFRMASQWTGDSVSYSTVEGRGCIRASVATRDAASLGELANGLNLWAQTRPADSATTVEAKGTVVVVTACESATPETIDPASQVRADFEARLVKEQVMLQQLNALGMSLTDPSVACAVNSYRANGMPELDSEIAAIVAEPSVAISLALRQSLQDLETFCSSAR